jgi:ATP-dependent Lon protease
LQEIPDNVKANLEIVPVRWLDKVLEISLVRMPTPLPEEEAVVAAPPAVDVVVTAPVKH